jgi:hypothetical protein
VVAQRVVRSLPPRGLDEAGDHLLGIGQRVGCPGGEPGRNGQRQRRQHQGRAGRAATGGS